MHVVIVGGGIMGVSLAWWLTRGTTPPAVTVVERDPSLATSSTMLSAASIRQQFSTPQNIRLSAFGWAFLTHAKAHLGEDAGLVRRGYLLLASTAGAEVLAQNAAVQQAEGAATTLLDPAALAARFAWLSTAGIARAALGRDEGWFDPATLHRGFLRGARRAGAVSVTGEVTGITRRAGRAAGVVLRDGGEIAGDIIVNAAGARAGAVAAMAGIDLPVGPDLRTVFHFTAPPGAAPADGPLVVDPAGFWTRPEGAGFLAGMESPGVPDDPWALAPDWPVWEETLWPALATRIPGFAQTRVGRAWAGPYDWNAHDQNALLGEDPACPGLVHVAGFSGHGLQHGPGIGRAMAALILTGDWGPIDLSVFAVTRLATGARVVERTVI